MAQRGSFQIDDIRIAKKDNVFLMDIDATLDEPNQIRKINVTNVELCNDGTLEFEEIKHQFWCKAIVSMSLILDIAIFGLKSYAAGKKGN